MALDLEILRRQVNHDDRLVKRLLQVFQTESSADEARLRAAVDSGDRERVHRLAHKLTGSLGDIAATNARRAAHQVGLMARQGDSQALAAALAGFSHEIARVHQEVESLLKKEP